MYFDEAKDLLSEKLLPQNRPSRIVHPYPRAGQITTTVFPSPLGKPVYIGAEGVIWLALCSADYLRRPDRQVPMPIGPSSRAFGYADKTLLLDENSGLPKSVKLFATDGTLACDYEVLATTNYLGRAFPVQFRVMQRGSPDNGSITPGSTTELEGKVTSIKPGTPPGLPQEARNKLPP